MRLVNAGLPAFAITAGGLLTVVGLSGDGARDAGTLQPLYAVPAEAVEIHALGWGETLGEVLERTSLSPSERHALLLAFQEQASPRRMRVGTEIVLRRRDSDSWLRGVDVALNGDETVRLIRYSHGWRSSLIRTPVVTDTVFAAGEIESVLWNAVVYNPRLAHLPMGDRTQLIHLLDQVFQWQVDFYRQIQPGDYYRVAFERQVRPDGSMRSARLIAAELANQGRVFTALWFDPGGDKGSYFDLEGRSVRRAFLLKPLEFRRISSRYSNSRFHPILKTWRAHRGIDYAANTGTPVQTTADGVVVYRGWKGDLGNLVEVQHTHGFKTRYGHLSGFRRGLSVGSRVIQGEVIGYVGSTGLANGPHLHYELWRHGKPVNPLALDLPAGDPVPESEWTRWETERRQRLNLLTRLPPPPDLRSAGSGNRLAEDLVDRE